MDVLKLLKEAAQVEAEAAARLVDQLDQSFVDAVQLIQQCEGKVVVSGVGKSGLIGRKIAASLASTGTPAFFVHASEAVHGDSGMIEARDVVILLSNSGETSEVLNLLPVLEQIGCKKIAITSGRDSTLARACDLALIYTYEREADHLNLAPTTSAVLMLIIGDALAVTLSVLKGFGQKDFYRYHPGGSLGAQLSNLYKESR
jgi:arabinose-5-phosphate isomerase